MNEDKLHPMDFYPAIRDALGLGDLSVTHVTVTLDKDADTVQVHLVLNAPAKMRDIVWSDLKGAELHIHHARPEMDDHEEGTIIETTIPGDKVRRFERVYP